MFMTVSILIEALGDIPLREVHIVRKNDISSVRIFTMEQELEKGILYLSPEKHGVRCRTDGGTSFCAQIDLFALLNRILSVFDDFTRWQSRLTQAAENGCTLTQLLNLSSPMIRHPLCILDANEWGIAYSDMALQFEMDEDWRDLVQKRTSNVEKVAAFNRLYYTYFRLKNVYHIPGNIFGEGYAINLFHNQTFCGILIMAVESKAESVSQGELDVLQYLGDLISSMISRNSIDVNTELPQRTLFDYLIQKDEGSFLKLEQSLKAAVWKKDDPKWLIYAEAAGAGYLAPRPSYAKPIFHRVDGIVAAEYEAGLVLLCNLRILRNRERAAGVVTDRLGQIFYYAGSSSEFYDLTVLGRMVEQAQVSLRSASPGCGSIHEFENSVTTYLISMLKQMDGGMLRHPCLDVLRNHDDRFGSHLYKTLFSYLKNERKITRTMADLDIPKSTLSNRLNKINELLGFSLEQPEVRLHILLSYLLDDCPPEEDRSVSKMSGENQMTL